MAGHDFEFCGPHGPAVLVLALPLVCYALHFACNGATCLQLWPELQLPDLDLDGVQLFTPEAFFWVTAWLGLILFLHLFLPSTRVQGVAQPNGKKLSYRLNAFTVLCIVYPAAVYFTFVNPVINLGWAYDNYLPLLTATTLLATALSVYLYASSFKPGALLAHGGNTGYPHYDFWMGRELNPRLSALDLKEWCELYPGLIGWALLNLAMAHKQYTALGRLTNSMLLVNGFELVYVVDALWNERAILTTMDITTDGFGFMLAFGDLVWVPFTYTLQAKFLVAHPQDLPWWAVALIIATALTGLYIFRAANGQKDQFRRDPQHPSVAHLKTLPTERGTKLIISGWWGTSRHINYFGDWIMGVAWCMPTGLAGLSAVVPYFYALYFGTLLVHRELRDEHNCRQKYGKDYDKYCSIVKYRIIPYVY